MAKNPAKIPTIVMEDITRRMARMQDMQATRAHVIKHHGLSEWRWLSTTPTLGHARDRAYAAASIREVRRLILENGYDTWEVCAIARDPGKFAFCDGGGATPENITE